MCYTVTNIEQVLYWVYPESGRLCFSKVVFWAHRMGYCLPPTTSGYFFASTQQVLSVDLEILKKQDEITAQI